MLDNQQRELEQGLGSLGISFTAQQVDRLLAFLAMLERWNKAFNLTSIHDPLQMLRLHVLDSAAIHHHIEGAVSVIDVGSGAGLPGIPLAILNPQKHFTLLDSNGKKTRFIFQAITELGLCNVREINQRAEQYRPKTPFDTVTSRAFSSLPKMLKQCDHLVASEGFFLAMKGKKPDLELSLITKAYKVVDLVKIAVPNVDGERHLVKIKKQALGHNTN